MTTTRVGGSRSSDFIRQNALKELRERERLEKLEKELKAKQEELKKREERMSYGPVHGETRAETNQLRKEVEQLQKRRDNMVANSVTLKQGERLDDLKEQAKKLEQEIDKQKNLKIAKYDFGANEAIQTKTKRLEADLEALNKRIARLEDRGVGGDYSADQKKLLDVEEQLKEKKDKLDSLNKLDISVPVEPGLIEGLQSDIKALKAEKTELLNKLRGTAAFGDSSTYTESAPPTTGTEDTRPRGNSTKTREVKSGESASSIALEMCKEQGLIDKSVSFNNISDKDMATAKKAWTTLYDQNKDKFGGNADTLSAGATLNVDLDFKSIWDAEQKRDDVRRGNIPV